MESSDDPHQCNICGRKYSNPKLHTMHFQQNTVEGLYYRCDICGIEFNLKSTLTSHRLTHANVRIFKCTKCPQTFTYLLHFLFHKRINHQKPPCKCTDCSKAIYNDVKIEDDLIEDETVEKKEDFLCKICPKTFRYEGFWRRHMLCHTREKRRLNKILAKEARLKCKLCGIKFEDKEQLKIHKRSIAHKNACTEREERKPHHCTFCPRRFQRRLHMIRHMEIHTARKRYRCVICVRDFFRREKLIAHQRSLLHKKLCKKFF